MNAGGEETKVVQTRADVWWGLGWVLLGLGILWGALVMDRLERLNINPYTAPGLVPGILGAFIALFGGILSLRALRAGVYSNPLPAVPADEAASSRREWMRSGITTVICLAFGAGLVGHGLPFWAAAMLFLFVHITVFQAVERTDKSRIRRETLIAAAVSIGASLLITFIFQELFLVHLP